MESTKEKATKEKIREFLTWLEKERDFEFFGPQKKKSSSS